MMSDHFVQEGRPSVRLQLLQLLQQRLKQSASHARAAMLEVILPALGALHREENPAVAVQGLQIVVDAAQQPANHDHFGTLIDLLAAFVLTPSAPPDGKQVALEGLFGMQPAQLEYHNGFTKHQQHLFVLLSGLLDSEDLSVRQRVLQFLLGFHSGTHEQQEHPSRVLDHPSFQLRQIPVVAWESAGRPAKHCALGVGSFVDTLIGMLVKETEWTLLEQATRGVCRMLQHKQLIRPNHLPQITNLACGQLGAPGGLGGGLVFADLEGPTEAAGKEGWLEGLAARVRCHLVGYTSMLEMPQRRQLCECLVAGMERLLNRTVELDDFAMRVLRCEHVLNECE